MDLFGKRVLRGDRGRRIGAERDWCDDTIGYALGAGHVLLLRARSDHVRAPDSRAHHIRASYSSTDPGTDGAALHTRSDDVAGPEPDAKADSGSDAQADRRRLYGRQAQRR